MVTISGIYKLSFFGDLRAYIGQSVNVCLRYKQHLKALAQNNHYNYKLQQLYNTLGPPEFEILEEVSGKDALNTREIYWVEHYDSFYSGLNLTTGGEGFGSGEDNPGSQHTNAEIVEAVKLLVSEVHLSIPEISQITKISPFILQNISSLASHNWLAVEEPELWAQLLEINEYKRHSAWFKNNKTQVSLVSPEGVLHEFTNINEFAATHNLSRSRLSSVLSGRSSHHKGWTLPGSELKVYKLVAPDGTIHEFTHQTNFATEHNLDVRNLSAVLLGKRKQHKNWTLPGSELKVHKIVSPEGILYEFTCIAEFARQHSLTASGISKVINKNRNQYKNWRLPDPSHQ
jgi:hypothetical protein